MSDKKERAAQDIARTFGIGWGDDETTEQALSRLRQSADLARAMHAPETIDQAKPLPPADALRHLWSSTEAFHQRFDAFPPQFYQSALMVDEEYREFKHECNLLEPNLEALTAEAADLVVTVMGALMARGVTLDAFETAICRVASKNDAKDHSTHYVNEWGKIARKKAKS